MATSEDYDITKDPHYLTLVTRLEALRNIKPELRKLPEIQLDISALEAQIAQYENHERVPIKHPKEFPEPIPSLLQLTETLQNAIRMIKFAHLTIKPEHVILSQVEFIQSEINQIQAKLDEIKAGIKVAW
ncbi:hypothetical protein FACS189487_11550 [Campylobacterota bacterium]|nr:hypothetical protein FACS189487_11550 [Campylobacterota bacterium]